MLDQSPWPDEEIEPPTLKEQFQDIFNTSWTEIRKAGQRTGQFFKNPIQKLLKRINKDE
jgi:hypothetical protein